MSLDEKKIKECTSYYSTGRTNLKRSAQDLHLLSMVRTEWNRCMYIMNRMLHLIIFLLSHFFLSSFCIV